MLEIKENQELNVTNILSFRGKIKQSELEEEPEVAVEVTHMEQSI